MKAFFSHYSMGFGLQQGWDMEQDYSEFAEAHKAKYTESEALTVQNKETGETFSVTEWDIFQLSQGVVENRAFVDSLVHLSQELSENGKNAGILSSSHSGSSDLLTPKKVLEADWLTN